MLAKHLYTPTLQSLSMPHQLHQDKWNSASNSCISLIFEVARDKLRYTINKLNQINIDLTPQTFLSDFKLTTKITFSILQFSVDNIVKRKF